MSAKDLCTIGFLDKIIRTGVAVLKIEGRGRSADYVYTVTKCYREAIQAYESGNYTPSRVDGWLKSLETVFNRGFWDGYYLGRRMGEWSEDYGSKASKRKVYVAKGLKYFEEAGAGEFKMEAQQLSVGDEVIITGPTTGIVQTVVEEIRVDDIAVQKSKKGEVFTIPLKEKIRPSDKLYKFVDVP
jgi:putative protease